MSLSYLVEESIPGIPAMRGAVYLRVHPLHRASRRQIGPSRDPWPALARTLRSRAPWGPCHLYSEAHLGGTLGFVCAERTTAGGGHRLGCGGSCRHLAAEGSGRGPRVGGVYPAAAPPQARAPDQSRDLGWLHRVHRLARDEYSHRGWRADRRNQHDKHAESLQAP